MMGSLSPLYHCTTGGFSIGQCGPIDFSRFQGDEQQSVPSVSSGKKRGSQDIPGGWKILVVKVIAVGNDEEILQPVLVAGFVFQFVENFYLGDG
jgi:hypothetical protein